MKDREERLEEGEYLVEEKTHLERVLGKRHSHIKRAEIFGKGQRSVGNKIFRHSKIQFKKKPILHAFYECRPELLSL